MSGFSVCVSTADFRSAKRQELPEERKIIAQDGVRDEGSDAILGKVRKLDLAPVWAPRICWNELCSANKT